MSNHTKVWSEKKAQLIQKEKELKEELEKVSSIFEGKTKRVLIISGITLIVGLLGYFGFKSTFSKEKAKKGKSRVKKSSKKNKKSFVASLITEKMISSLLQYLGNQIGEILKGTEKKSS